MKPLFLIVCIEVAFLLTPSLSTQCNKECNSALSQLHNLPLTVFSNSALSSMAYWKVVHSEMVYISESPTSPGSRAARTTRAQKMHMYLFRYAVLKVVYMSSLEARGIHENATATKRRVARKSTLIENHRKTTKYKYDLLECWFKHSSKCSWTFSSLPNALMVDRPNSVSDSWEYIGLHAIISSEHCVITEERRTKISEQEKRCIRVLCIQ